MLRPRIIPCLLVRDKGLVKTFKFEKDKYVGDPINAVRIFNEKETDELMVVDIDATSKGYEPDYTMIQHLASECRMPLCYGGGVKTLEQARKIISLGVEKVAVSSAAVDDPDIVKNIAEEIGSQSIVVVADIKKQMFGKYALYTHNGTKKRNSDVFEFIKKAEENGAGEIIVNTIDRDGEMCGYDIELARKVRDTIHLPLTMLGGAGSLDDIGSLIREFGIIGAAAGSLFVFKGVYKAVLINYPSPDLKDKIIFENTSM